MHLETKDAPSDSDSDYWAYNDCSFGRGFSGVCTAKMDVVTATEPATPPTTSCWARLEQQQGVGDEQRVVASCPSLADFTKAEARSNWDRDDVTTGWFTTADRDYFSSFHHVFEIPFLPHQAEIAYENDGAGVRVYAKTRQWHYEGTTLTAAVPSGASGEVVFAERRGDGTSVEVGRAPIATSDDASVSGLAVLTVPSYTFSANSERTVIASFQAADGTVHTSHKVVEVR
ncbi:hypothetical protein ET445_03670 [Agromyces protaetiae]|uniref:Uncharacterized protein n=1 Tax=Agromyces protaetiae TaxID=2509455 RepID=A0A4P6FFM3_9MICO|nr:hypothetical protein [Agromyces protaetiae]QAY72577.1 hypothetical protein ET445_03670 [Agromyces protaetiae]